MGNGTMRMTVDCGASTCNSSKVKPLMKERTI
jgi:hypothetical protein